MPLSKQFIITAVVLLLLFARLTDALLGTANSHNFTSCFSINQTHTLRPRISKRALPSQVWQSAWNELQPAFLARCAALAVDGRDYYNEIIFRDVAGAASLISQRTNAGQPDPLIQSWQRYPHNLQYISRKLSPPVWAEMDITNQARDSFRPIQELVAAQRVGTTGKRYWRARRNANTRKWPDGPNICLRQHQSVQYYKLSTGEDTSKEGRKKLNKPTIYPPTGAAYETWFNLVDGIIINRRAIGPKAAARTQAQWRNTVPRDSQLPSIYHWSELVFTGWMQSLRSEMVAESILNGPIDWMIATNNMANNRDIRTSPMKTFLNFVIIQAIDAPATTSNVIKTCLMSQDYGARITSWPDKARFSVGSWCFYALLDLPVNKGIAYLLAQHKNDPDQKLHNGIGHKVLEYVEISSGKVPEDPDWYSFPYDDITLYRNRHTNEVSRKAPDGFEEPDMAEWKWGFSPTLIWKVVDYDASIVQQARTNEQQWSVRPLYLNGMCGDQEQGQSQRHGEAPGYSGKGKGRAHDI
ncbi:hypothetical protein CERZMDRAFT_86202 [Cercospora zeae-maydis SCOH1-5]|uniref:Alginate lyase domain-containing protein n=1 Tax=Cercospora zeae-maydis SCOH1-5 TaxID=717836 RepID=A0A6A6FAN2_9PEZI|nr:hypothetical protein CERZMDRAFT_86202 [Cercospora zeae-maydis SCOH1-5]